MYIIFVSVFVPIVLAAVVPAALGRAGFAEERRWRWWLYAACMLFWVSWYLPSPLIEGRDTSFTTHFVGGGMFTGLLWYLREAVPWLAQQLVGRAVLPVRPGVGTRMHQ